MKVAIVAAFGLLVGYTTYNSQKEETALSELLLDNVEALAGEYGSGSGCFGTGCRIDSFCDCFSVRDGVIVAYCPYMRGF